MPPSEHHAALGGHEALNRVEILTAQEAREVFRFVHTSKTDDPTLIEDFRSDAALHKPVRGRAKRIPELHDGMSAFRTVGQARERWNDVAALAQRRGEPVRLGDYIARVDLKAGLGFAYEDPGEADGHMTIWGDPTPLAAAVTEILPADR